jgi:ATP-binding cassette subfamily C protein LapB
MTENTATPELLPVLARLATWQREAIDRLTLQEAAQSAALAERPEDALSIVSDHLRVRPARWRDSPDAADLPALVYDPEGRWGILRGRNAHGQWITEWFDGSSRQWQESAHDELPNHRFAILRLQSPYRATDSPVLRLVLDELSSHRALLVEAGIGGLVLAVLGVFTAFYSLQIYDRVIPTGATQTLLVLTLGILVAIALEFFTKHVRSRLYERLVDRVDQRLARTIYLRFLAVRLDQLPPSVGSLASQLRGYESVRGFLVGLTSHLLVDAPFALAFALAIAAIAGVLALVPLAFLAVALAIGLWNAKLIGQLTRQSQAAANLKTGLLVETVEGAEIIKSGQGGWRMLNRWLASTDESRDVDLQLRHINENAQHFAATMQQVSYVMLVATGAWLASQGHLTMGGLIACSILSGRVLGPIAGVSQQLVSWGHVRAALQGLDALWKLEDDHHGQAQPILLDSLRGAYRFENVTMHLAGRAAFGVPQLVIAPREKIGVLGPIGAGKTTFLRLLSGMYKPQDGRILLDDIDLAFLAKPFLAEHMGYLPQEGRLLSGTLRENLILGLLDPGDDAILAAARTTGLFDSVIASHPKGLERAIAEGGTGLSGGQRQLVNLTRIFLREPRIWLLDEPTASLDRNTEVQVTAALRSAIRPEDTLVIVTHKPEMLQLVDRLIVVANQQIVLDGPREAVIERLQSGTPLASSRGTSPPAMSQRPEVIA